MVVLTGGNRRIDKVLAEHYLDGLQDAPLADVRSLRDDASQEETDLSYLRRMLQGRIDIVLAAARRRGGGLASSPLVLEDLPKILADQHRGPARGMGRYQSAEPTNAGATRRAEEQMASVDVTELDGRDDQQLEALLVELQSAEADISARRRSVQEVVDATTTEITRRYRDGSAAVGDLLRQEGA